MTARKHNEFLDIAPSDEDDASDHGYDSEAKEAESKGRAVKRRRTADTQEFFGLESDEDGQDDDGDGDEEMSRTEMKGKGRGEGGTRRDAEEEDEDEEDRDEHASQHTSLTLQTHKPKKQASTKPQPKKKTGVIYLSSLPPYLKPSALKSMLEARGFTPITKVFLSPAIPSSSSSSSSTRRSNKRKTYTDGWVEFASKKTAKICASTLNASIIGGKKGGWYHDDVWNMKYLRGFKWDDLMEQVQRERSEREAKRRIEDSRARKEERVFIDGVERGRVFDGIYKKREGKKRRLGDIDMDPGHRVDEDVMPDKVRRRFQQNQTVGSGDAGKKTLKEDATRVLGKIF